MTLRGHMDVITRTTFHSMSFSEFQLSMNFTSTGSRTNVSVITAHSIDTSCLIRSINTAHGSQIGYPSGSFELIVWICTVSSWPIVPSWTSWPGRRLTPLRSLNLTPTPWNSMELTLPPLRISRSGGVNSLKSQGVSAWSIHELIVCTYTDIHTYICESTRTCTRVSTCASTC